MKCFLYRSIGLLSGGPDGQPRRAVIADPKGEYGPLATALGMQHVTLAPGGATRLNPLDPGPIGGRAGRDERIATQTAMVAALATEARHAPISELEQTALGWAVEALCDRAGRRPPTLGDLAALLANPTDEMAARSTRTAADLARAIEGVRFGFERLLSGSMRGMFDGHSTVRLDWQGRGLVLDLSAVYGTPALGPVMVAATGWLQGALFGSARGHGRWYQVIDEAWALLGSRALARHYQASQKLARSRGVVNIAVTHRVSDLNAQADDGTAASKIATGFLADTQTRVLFHQDADQVDDARRLLALTPAEAQLLPSLIKGRALWKIGERTAVVAHRIAGPDWVFAGTDEHMTIPAEVTR